MLSVLFVLTLLTTVLTGCGGSDATNPVSPSVDGTSAATSATPSSTPVPAPVTAASAVQLTSNILPQGLVDAHILANAGSKRKTGDTTSLPHASPLDPNTTAVSLALSALLTRSGTITSPLGGSAVCVTSGSTVTETFDDLITPSGVVRGTLKLSLTADAAGETVADVVFTDVRVANRVAYGADGPAAFSPPVDSGGREAWGADGPAAIGLDGTAKVRVQNAGARHTVDWTAGFTLTNLSTADVTKFTDLVASSTLVTSGSNVSGTATLRGAMTLATGTLLLDTTTPIAFSGGLVNGIANVHLTDGVLRIQGTSPVELRVSSGDIVQLVFGGNVLRRFAFGLPGGGLQVRVALNPVSADTVYLGGNVVTVNAKKPSAQAVAVRDGRILFVGTDAEMVPFIGSGTEVVALKGKTLLPGFIEPHMHYDLSAINDASAVIPQIVNCGKETLDNTIEQVLANVAKAAVGAKGVYGFSFDPSRLVASELMQQPTRQQLDAISTTIPILVANASGHISYANSEALRISGLWPTAPNLPFNPPADLKAYIPVDANGYPTGQLNENAQQPAALPTVKAAVDGQFVKVVDRMVVVQRQAAAVGVTTTCDMLTGGSSLLELDGYAAAFAALQADPLTPVRIRSYISGLTPLDKISFFPFEGNDLLRYVGIKFTTDGSTQGFTAGLNFDYMYQINLPAALNGLLNYADAAALFAVVKPYHDRGWPLSFHVNGDRAQDMVFTTIGQLLAASPRKDPRFRMEHFTVHTDAELATHVALAKKYEVQVGHTIGHVYYWGQVFNNTILGPVSSNLDPAHSLIKAGVNVELHSDCPVTPMNPLRYIQTAVTRLWQGLPQQALGPQEAITVDEAIRCVTINAAHAAFMERDAGSIEGGKYADFVCLDADPRKVDPNTIAQIKVLATVMGGRKASGTLP